MAATHVTIRVAWYDADPAGIVWLGNFLRYVEQAEEELLRAAGVTKQYLRTELQTDLPRAQIQCAFRSPARYGEELDVAVEVADLTERRIRFTFEIRHLDGGGLVVEGSYDVACVDSRTFTCGPVPEALRAALQPIAR